MATNEGDDAAFDHRDRVTAGPKVVADQGSGWLVVLGGAANRRWREGGPGRRGEGAEGGAAREAFAASGETCPRWTVSINAVGSIA